MLKIFEKAPAISRNIKQTMLILIDSVLLLLFFFLAMWLKLETVDFFLDLKIWIMLAFVIPICVLTFLVFGVYRSVLRYLSTNIFKTLSVGLSISAIIIIVYAQTFTVPIPHSVPVIFVTLSIIGIPFSRFMMHKALAPTTFKTPKNVVVYGAGAAGRQLVNALKNGQEFKPIFFIDDEPSFNGRVINGLPVHNFEDAVAKIKSEGIQTILLAMPSISLSAQKTALQKLAPLNIELKTMPSLTDIIEGRTEISHLQHIKIEKLMEREPIPPIPDLMDATIKGKNVLVTGAGGSIGRELCRQILALGPNRLLLFDHSEFNLFEIERELSQMAKADNNSSEIIARLGSIQCENSVLQLFKAQKIDTVYHAAAYKHVPLAEENCVEAVKNNVLGTYTLTKVALKSQVTHFILISTDKAVRPTNIMGATKRLSELICQSAASLSSTTFFSIVRFGNVLGSSGSVIPLFTEQLKNGGPITVTHKDITRFFMTITEAAQLVIQAASLTRGGEVFLLDMGKPVKIVELAERMASLQGMRATMDKNENADIRIVITGLRPGEKLFEELLINDDAQSTRHPRIMMAKESMVSVQAMDVLIKKFKKACDANNSQRVTDLLKSAPLGFNKNE